MIAAGRSPFGVKTRWLMITKFGVIDILIG